MTMKDKVFPDSKQLKDIIDSHNWILYDVTVPAKAKTPTWEEIAEMKIPEQYIVGRNYLFVPKPATGQTLREAYSQTKGLGPSLDVSEPEDSRWEGLVVKEKSNGMIAFFTRLFFEDEFLIASSPKTTFIPEPDVVAINYRAVIDTFQKKFRIVLPEEYGLQAPVPMPWKPENN